MIRDTFKRPSQSLFSPKAPQNSEEDSSWLSHKSAQGEVLFDANREKKIHELSFPFRSVMIGAGIGGVAGFYNGIKAANLAQQTGKLRRTQLINHVMKQGSATANTLGTIAVLYSAFGVLLSLARGEDDEANTIVAGAATGLMYKSTAGLRKCMIGGGVGLALSSLWVLYNVAGSKQKFNDFKQYV